MYLLCLQYVHGPDLQILCTIRKHVVVNKNAKVL